MLVKSSCGLFKYKELSIMKKFISVFLSLVLILSVFSISVFGAKSGDFTYTVLSEADKTCKITEYSGSSKDVVIPAELNGYKVTAIEILTFYMNKALTVELPATVNSLNGQSFNEMNSTVNSITVAEDSPYYSSVDGVLYNKDKTALVCYPAGKADEIYTVLDGVELIDYYSFSSCLKLKEIILPDSLKSIDDWAFNNCTALAKINLPDGLSSIGASAFRNCRAIEELTVPDSVTFIDGAAFYNCQGLKSIKLSENIDSIYRGTFTSCSSLENIKIPESVKTVYSQSFYGCDSFTEIVIPNSVTVLEDAFHSCDNLERVVLSENITTLESHTFNDCFALKTIEIPKGVTNIEENAFEASVDLVIVCEDNSVAKTYAAENGFSYILEDEDTRLYVASEYIYEYVTLAKTNGIISGSDDITCSANEVYAGTGDVLSIMKNGTLHSQYTLIVNGDTNGDSAVDALDAAQVAMVSKGLKDIDGVYKIAADSNKDDVVDIDDYQAIVNKVVA